MQRGECLKQEQLSEERPRDPEPMLPHYGKVHRRYVGFVTRAIARMSDEVPSFSNNKRGEFYFCN
jgi:hypothetical protein